MTDLINYLIFSGTLITLAVIATIYQMIKKGLFRISVQVEDDPEKEGTVEIEVTGGSDYKDFLKGMMPRVRRKSDNTKNRKHDPRLNTPEDFLEEQEKRMQTGSLKKSFTDSDKIGNRLKSYLEIIF